MNTPFRTGDLVVQRLKFRWNKPRTWAATMMQILRILISWSWGYAKWDVYGVALVEGDAVYVLVKDKGTLKKMKYRDWVYDSSISEHAVYRETRCDVNAFELRVKIKAMAKGLVRHRNRYAYIWGARHYPRPPFSLQGILRQGRVRLVWSC
jgi:hypothetical protein